MKSWIIIMMLGWKKGGMEGWKSNTLNMATVRQRLKELNIYIQLFGFVSHLKRLKGVTALVTMKTAFRLSTPGSKFQPAGRGTLPFPDILNLYVFLHN
jgi:hypothetical protein